jgi:hypothetical protein
MLTVVIGIVLLLIDYFFVENAFWSLILATLSSSAISIAGALLITEWLLKPLYVRDVIQVAGLSAEIHRAGIRYARTNHDVVWSEILAGSSDISSAIGNENVFRSGPWVAIMEASRASRRSVRLHVSQKLANSGFATLIEQQWRDNGCKTNGSSLSVIPHSEVTQGLVLQCGSWVAATIADDPLNDDPLFLVFMADSRESAVAALKRGMGRLNDSPTRPIAGA